jgi:hypothetical protein
VQKLKVRSIKVGAVLSRRNEYGNDRLEIEVEVAEGENVAEVYEEAKAAVYGLLGHRDLYERNSQLRHECAELTLRVKKAQMDWQKASQFMVAQGLKTEGEIADFPVFSNLLPGAIDGELEDECFSDSQEL